MIRLTHAEQLLQSYGITDPSEIDLEAIAWDQGVKIKYRKLDGCEARIIGMGDKAIMSINESSSKRRQRFSIGHELGHWKYDRGKPSLCFKGDIGNYATTSNLNNPERVADRYSADLLLPKYLFDGVARQYKKSTFQTIEEIANIFDVSITATAIRYVEYGFEPCVLVCHSQSGKEWFKRHRDIPSLLFPNDEVDSQSPAFDVVFGDKNKVRRSLIGADAWFNLSYASHYEMYEETIKISDGLTLTLLTWENEDLFSRIDSSKTKWR